MTPADLWKPSSAGFIANPYPVYKQIRSCAPVFQSTAGDYVVIGYHACKQVLQDPSCTTGLRKDWVHKMVNYAGEKGENFESLKHAINGMLIQLNAPPHPIIRSAMAKAWPSTQGIRKLAQTLSEQFVADLPRSFDAMETLCRRLPLNMICSIMGLPAESASSLMKDGLRMVQLLDPYLTYRDLKEIQEASIRIKGFISTSIRSGNYTPTPLSQAILDLDPKEMNEHEIDPISILTFLFIAGFETTSTLLATCIHQLVLDKTLLQTIDKSSTQGFIREILRLYSPVQITGRLTTRTIHLGGVTIPENNALTLCIGAANLDVNHFEEPDMLLLNRSSNDHLSFGYGMHHCLGSQLAELEAEALIQAMEKILPKLQLSAEPTLEPKLTIRSYQTLPLTIK